jgi:hypothetical protein
LRTFDASALRAVAVTALAALLAGCAGARTSLPPTGAQDVAAATDARTVESARTAAPAPTLYVAAADRVNAFRLHAAGAAAPTRSITIANAGDSSSKIVAIATRGGGVLGVLEDVVNPSYASETVLVELSASANGNVTPAATFGLCGSTGSIGCHGTGLVHLPVGAGYWASLLRGTVGHRLQYTADGLSAGGTNYGFVRSSGLAVDRGSDVYLSGAPTDPSGVDKYRHTDLAITTSVPAPAPPPESSTVLPNGTGTGPIAVGPDLRVYVAAVDGSNRAIVDVFTQATAAGPFVYSGSLGPFPKHAIDALAVDAQGDLYVGMFALSARDRNVTEVRVYGACASGAPTMLLRTLRNPVPTRITSLAIFQ